MDTDGFQTGVDQGLLRRGLACVAILMLTACAPQPRAMAPADAPVTINFTNGCPTSVTPAGPVTITRNQKIEWTSSPANIDFDIYFDPFRGKVYQAGNDGKVKSQPARNDAPLGEYKYTVAADGCAALDPRIIVN